MSFINTSRITLLVAGLTCAVLTRAAGEIADANWPQWRGPLGTGVAPKGNPPVSWSETENVKWKVKIPGGGHATPVVWGDRLFVLTAIPTGKKVEAPADAPPPPPPPPPGEGGPGRQGGRRGMGGPKPTEVHQFAILCLNRNTGKVLWQQTAREEVPHEGFRQGEGSLASGSPLTDGERVYAFFGSRGLYCYDLDGKARWNQDLGDMRVAMGFGEGSSPALYQDTLVVSWDHEGDSFIVALDKQTGTTRWKKTREERTSWSTPLVVAQGGKPQVIVTATGKIRGYDLATGDVVWECGGLTPNVIPSPVAAEGVVYAMSGFRGNSLLAIRLGRTGDLTGSDAILWSHKKSTPYVPSPLLYGDKLYFLANNNGMLSVFDARTGTALIDAERLEAIPGVYASPVGASGRVYLVGRNGATLVIKQAEKLEVLATNRLDEKFDASPAIAGKDLFLRGREYLYCLAEK
jgi:outer membrane protein assembly factor BamB